MKSIAFTLAFVASMHVLVVRADSKPISLEEVIRETLLHSPDAAKIDASIAERAAEAFSVEVMENPVLDTGVEVPLDPPKTGTEDVGVSIRLSQAIRPTDFGQRTVLAKLMSETADIEKIISLNELIQNLGILYARAWQLQETSVFLRDSQKRVSSVVKKVGRVSTGGVLPEGDLELLKTEVKVFEAEMAQTQALSAQTEAELIKLSAFSTVGRTLLPPPDTIPFSREGLEELVRASKLPIQRRFELLSKLSNKQLEVARSDVAPIISPSLGFGRHDDGTNQVLLGVSIPLPVFNRNQPAIIRAEGAVLAAKRGEQYSTSDAIVAEALASFDTLIRLREQVEFYEKGIVPGKRRAADAYNRQFEAGAGATFQLWQSQRELNLAQMKNLELRGALATARAQAMALIGQQF